MSRTEPRQGNAYEGLHGERQSPISRRVRMLNSCTMDFARVAVKLLMLLSWAIVADGSVLSRVIHDAFDRVFYWLQYEMYPKRSAAKESTELDCKRERKTSQWRREFECRAVFRGVIFSRREGCPFASCGRPSLPVQRRTNLLHQPTAPVSRYFDDITSRKNTALLWVGSLLDSVRHGQTRSYR